MLLHIPGQNGMVGVFRRINISIKFLTSTQQPKAAIPTSVHVKGDTRGSKML